ncbi:hypothetical protein EKO25_18410 [Bacillus sp. SAJ1]|nr:hypothetical protein EKO25_18410 [Bacillus sp. SAJ1]
MKHIGKIILMDLRGYMNPSNFKAFRNGMLFLVSFLVSGTTRGQNTKVYTRYAKTKSLMSFIKYMKDKLLQTEKLNVLHQVYEGQVTPTRKA